MTDMPPGTCDNKLRKKRGTGTQGDPAMRSTSWTTLVFVAICASATGAEITASNTGSDASAFHFVPHEIDTNRCESCNFGDFNNDGQLDIISGERLYLAPDFNPRVIRTINTEGLEFLKEGGVRRYDLDKVGEDGNGYLDVFMDEPLDVDRDGWLDVVSSGWFNEKISWYRNPEGEAGTWEEHIISSEMGNHETGELYDIDGDGIVAEVMPFTWSTLWFELTVDAKGNVAKTVYTISDERHPFLGGGVGDVNGDGHPDIIRSKAWFEAPRNPRDENSWIEHPHNIGGPDGMADQVSLVEVYDVDEDGFSDLVTSSAHNYGIFWYRQIRKGREISWEQHVIDDSWTQAQAVRLADMDGDGDKVSAAIGSQPFWQRWPE